MFTTIGEELKRARDYVGFSLADAAKHIRCTEDELAAFEAGTVRPNMITVRRLGRLYSNTSLFSWNGVSAQLTPPVHRPELDNLVNLIVETPATKEDIDEVVEFARFLRARKQIREHS